MYACMHAPYRTYQHRADTCIYSLGFAMHNKGCVHVHVDEYPFLWPTLHFLWFVQSALIRESKVSYSVLPIMFFSRLSDKAQSLVKQGGGIVLEPVPNNGNKISHSVFNF